jgi:hypothetical protein
VNGKTCRVFIRRTHDIRPTTSLHSDL